MATKKKATKKKQAPKKKAQPKAEEFEKVGAFIAPMSITITHPVTLEQVTKALEEAKQAREIAEMYVRQYLEGKEAVPSTAWKVFTAATPPCPEC